MICAETNEPMVDTPLTKRGIANEVPVAPGTATPPMSHWMAKLGVGVQLPILSVTVPLTFSWPPMLGLFVFVGT